MVPEAPVTIDLGGGGGGPEFGFILSGVTGVGADSLNGRYELSEPGIFVGPGMSVIVLESYFTWIIVDAETTRFLGSGEWPWTVTEWVPQMGGEGTPACSQAPSPFRIDLGSDATAVAAALTTNLTGSNNDLIFTSKLSGRLGNSIRIRYVNPGTNNASLGVVVSGRDITVNLATNGSAAITSTAVLVANAIEASAAASALVSVSSVAAVNGVVTAMGWTSLSGGAGGLPLPPSTLTL